MKKAPSTPKNFRLYAVGDIHGRQDLLARLLAMIESDALAHPEKTNRLIFLGDYIDRGVDSCGVIDHLLRPLAPNLKPIFLRGNHEDLLLRFLNDDMEIAPLWLHFGGSATIASYGVNPYPLGTSAEHPQKLQKLREALLKALPSAHRAFIENTLLAVTYGDYYFVHAGVRPGVLLRKQRPEDQMWIRDAFLSHTEAMEKIIVHGHTIRAEVDVQPNRIGIDTGAYASGQLTCLVLDGTERQFFST